MEEEAEVEIGFLLRFLAGLSAFLFFLTISLTLLALSGSLPITYPLLSGIALTASFIFSFIARRKVSKTSKKQAEKILDRLSREEMEKVRKNEHEE